ncbi:MAG TPA: hypothetical protein VF720_04620, partial [Candidatus Eisenbacteria bacterium]
VAFTDLMRPGLYGWCFFVFAAGLICGLAGWRRVAGDVRLLAGLVAVEFLAVVFLYQQIDPAFGGGTGSYFLNSMKRALFILMPGAAAAGCLLLATRAPEGNPT